MKGFIIAFAFLVAFAFLSDKVYAPDILTLGKNFTLNASLTGSINLMFTETCNSANNHSTNCTEMELRSADNNTRYAVAMFSMSGDDRTFVANITGTTINQNITVTMAYNNTTAYTGYRNNNDALIFWHNPLYNNTNSTRPIAGGTYSIDGNSHEVTLSGGVSDITFYTKKYNTSFRLEYRFQFSGAKGDMDVFIVNDTILNPCTLCRGYEAYTSYSPADSTFRRDDGAIRGTTIIDGSFVYDENPHNQTIVRFSNGTIFFYFDNILNGTVTDNTYSQQGVFDRVGFWQADVNTAKINNISIMAWGDRAEIWSLGQAYLFSPPPPPAVNPTVSFDSPANDTFLRNNVTLNFTVTGDSTTYNCSQILTGNGTTALGNTTNDTYSSRNLGGLEPTQYNATVQCSDNSGDTATASRLFSIIHWNITVNQSTSPVYETNWTIFRLNVSTIPTIDNVNASLRWNSTNYANSTFNVSDQQRTFTRNQSIPLLVTNNTGVAWYWSFNVTYTNGTDVNNRTTAEGNQSLIFAYVFSHYNTSTSSAFEGQSFMVNSTVNKQLDYAVIRSNLTFNATNITNSSYVTRIANTFFGYNTIVPLISETSVNATFNLTFLISYGGASRTVYSNNTNLNITRVVLGNCTSGSQSTKIMSFVGKDEETFANLTQNYTLEATFLVWNHTNTVRNYSFIYTNQTAYDLCVSPSTVVAYINSSMEYDAEANYPKRTYYLVNAKVRGTSDNSSVNVIDHYLLNSSLATLVTVTIKDTAGTPLSDLYLTLLRYSTSTNTYATVQISKSDFEGKAIVRARLNDAFYRITVDDGVTVRTTKDTFQIKTASFSITVNPTPPIGYFQYFGKIAYECAYTNSTLTLECTVTDLSKLMSRACLYLYQVGTLSDTLLTTSCQASSTAVVGYTWASWADIQGRRFNYRLYAETTLETDNRVYLLGRPLELSAVVSVLGLTGVFLASMVVTTVSIMGFWSPPIAIMLGLISLTVLSVLDLVSLPMDALASIIFVGLIFIWRIRK